MSLRLLLPRILAGILLVFPSCARLPPSTRALVLPMDVARVEVGVIQSQRTASTLHGLTLRVGSTARSDVPWSARLTIFDDRDGDWAPDTNEVLATREAYGTRGGRVAFPKVRWSGVAHRPAVWVKVNRDGRAHEGWIPLHDADLPAAQIR